MLSAGVAEQLALWITQGRPEMPMFNYDIRRFIPAIREHRSVITEKTLESYVRNYDIAYNGNQPMAGRNFKTDLFHEVNNNMLMAERFLNYHFFVYIF